MDESEFTSIRDRFQAQIKTWDVHSTVKLMLQRMVLEARFKYQNNRADGELHIYITVATLSELIDRSPSTVSKYILDLESKGYLVWHERYFRGLRHLSLRLQGSEG